MTALSPAKRAALFRPQFKPTMIGGLVLWLAADRSPLSLSTASYAGSGTITQSGTTVTGSSSSFLGEVKVGDVLTADAGSPLISGTVTAIASATSLTLSTSATQASGQTYTVNPVAGTTDRVTQINDLSGLGNHASQATQANKPVLRTLQNGIGSRPCLLFDGINDLLSIADTDLLSGGAGRSLTAAVVGTITATNGGSNQTFVSKWAAAGNQREWRVHALDIGSSLEFAVTPDGSTITAVDGPNAAADTPYVLVGTHSTGAAISLAVSGSSSTQSFVGGISDLSSAVVVGALANPANWLLGKVGAVVLYNRALANREQRKLEVYLGRKWGIAV